jgi:hypothetical protein
MEEEEGGRRLREPLARRGVDKRDYPVPFTLLDKVVYSALLFKSSI